MRVFILLMLALYLHGGVFDFMDIKEAKEAYAKKEYQKAAKYYEKLSKSGNDEARFNLADSYYKSGNYKKALSNFEKIKDKKLKFKKLHNMGNCYAKLGDIDKALKSYEEALKIKEDKDTRFNYELLKKKKEQKKQKKNQKKKDKKEDKNKKQNNKEQNKKNQNKEQKKNDQKDSKNKKEQNKNSDDKNHKKEKKRKDQTQKQKNSVKEKKEDKKERKKNQNKEQNKKQKKNDQKKAVPISDMQERKYKKMLEQRGINTLMMELPTKGERKDEIKPW